VSQDKKIIKEFFMHPVNLIPHTPPLYKQGEAMFQRPKRPKALKDLYV